MRHVMLKVNNKMKGAYGSYDERTGMIEVNRKKHKSRIELADTIKHELMHARHPKMHEKTVYKKTKMAIKKMSQEEKDKLISKLRSKKLNYKMGAFKRKFKVSRSEHVEAGSMIRKMNERKRVAIAGLV